MRRLALWLIGIALLAVHGPGAREGSAAPGLGRPGYALTKASAGVPASGISRLAFRSGDPTHVYCARTSGVITRYDYDPATGQLSNPLDVATAPGWAVHALAFHGTDLYASFNAPPAGARLARFSDPDARECIGPGTISFTPFPPAPTASTRSRSSAARCT